MATIGRLVIDLMAKTGQFTSGLNKAKRDVKGFSNTAKMALAGIARAAVPIGAGLGLVSLLREVETFNRAMTRSLAIMGNVTADLRKQMEQSAIAVAKTTQFSATEAAEAYYFLASAGLDAKRAMEALPTVAQFAQAGNFDLATATDLATDAQSALGLASKDSVENLQNLTRVSDVLVKANTLANASVQQFSESLTNKAGAAARLVGKDIEEVVAVLSVFADQGLKGAEAGTAFAIVMRDLQTAAIKNAAVFKSMGVAVFDAQGEMLPIFQIVASLEDAIGGLSDEQTKLAFSQLGFTDKSIAFTQALLGASKQIEIYEKQLRKAAGTTKDVADNSLTPLQKSLSRLKGEFFGAAQGGSEFANSIAKAVEGVADLVAGLNKLIKQFRTGEFREMFKPAHLRIEEAQKEFRDRQALPAENFPPAVPAFDAAAEAVKAGVEKAIEAAGNSSPLGGVGAINERSAEGFNNLQRALQGKQDQVLKENMKQTAAQQQIKASVDNIRRLLEKPSTQIEFA